MNAAWKGKTSTMKFLKLLLSATAFAAIVTPTVQATMLIVVYTPDGYWIGADSARSSDTAREDTVCKVHETKWGLLLKGGASAADTYTGEEYSTDGEVETLLANSTSPGDFKTKLKFRFHKDIDAELAFRITKSEEMSPFHRVGLEPPTPENLENSAYYLPMKDSLIGAMDRTVILMDSDARSTGEILEVRPQNVFINGSSLAPPTYHYVATTYEDWTSVASLPPSVWTPEGDKSFPPSVRIFMHPVSYAKSNAWVQEHPQEALRVMLQIGHLEDPIGIGEPYVIVHVVKREGKPDDVQWLSRGVCHPENQNGPLQKIEAAPLHTGQRP